MDGVNLRQTNSLFNLVATRNQPWECDFCSRKRGTINAGAESLLRCICWGICGLPEVEPALNGLEAFTDDQRGRSELSARRLAMIA